MSDTPAPDVTALLDELTRGVPDAADRLAPIVYDELHRRATLALQREAQGHTLQPTELVHETFLRLVGQRATWRNRSQFYAVASQAIRRLLIDHARKRRSAKRDHGIRVTLDESIGDRADAAPLDLLALDDALRRLEAADPRQGRVVELRFFAGLSVEDTAAALDVSPATVKRDWTFARAFLLRALEGASPPEA